MTAESGGERDVDFGFDRVSPSEKTRRVREVFDSVAGRYDVMNDLMSLGFHRGWKRLAVLAASARPGDRVLDLAAGTGDLSRLLAARVGADGHVVATDINHDMLSLGRDRLIDAGASGVSVAQVDAACLPFPNGSFDIVTIAFGLRNVTDKVAALHEMTRVLRPGGRALILEFSRLRVPALVPAYDAYSFRVLPALGRLVAGDAESYRYLAESIRMHPDQETLLDMMRARGSRALSLPQHGRRDRRAARRIPALGRAPDRDGRSCNATFGARGSIG